MTQNIFLITGITSGLGFETAKQLLSDPNNHIITGVRHADGAAALRTLSQDRISTFQLDLATLSSVSAFCDQVLDHLQGRKLAGVGLNAGMDSPASLEFTDDGFERTFAVNFLAHWLIGEKLQDVISGTARVVVTGSGTYDPNDALAVRFGHRGGVFPSAERVAIGDLDASVPAAQQARDRYATSKMLNVMHALYKAREDRDHVWIAYDPGMMPGTGLARNRNGLERFIWRTFMPVLTHIIDSVSSIEKSGKMLADLLDGRHLVKTGTVVDFRGKALPLWEKVTRVPLQTELHRFSQQALATK